MLSSPDRGAHAVNVPDGAAPLIALNNIERA